MCLYPKLIKNPKYKINKKNGGNIPAIYDERVLYVPIGCEKCIECRKQKAREWQCRLLEDIKTHTNGKFITFTFSDENYTKLAKKCNGKGYELDNQIARLAMKLFRKRWHKEYGQSIRRWLISELGGNGSENIHLHGIIWTDLDLKEVERIWQYGWVWKGKEVKGKLINYVNENTVNYSIKYITKQDTKHPNYKSIILTSPGIGSNFTKTGDWKRNQFKDKDTNETYRTRTGHKLPMPIYWRNKIYSEEERERLWLLKLDKQERWILGSRVDISKGDEEYRKGLKWAQTKNTELGYGGHNTDEEQIEYERQRRQLMQLTRMKNKNPEYNRRIYNKWDKLEIKDIKK